VPERPAGPDGLAVVDKEAGWTSHDVVAKARGLLGTRKVGHAGTLDPDATGVLLVGAGKVTRLLRFLTILPKSYVGEMVLGVETSTLDASGEVRRTHDMAHVTPSDVDAVLPRFTGEIKQVPPMVSAVKVGGRRLHELAREGVEVDRQPRPVTVHRLAAAVTGEPSVYRIEVDCSSGTYVRTLAADIGAALGGGAHLRNLRRVAVGPFTVDGAVPVARVSVDALLPPAAALAHLDAVTADAEMGALVAHGRVVERATFGVDDGAAGPWAVLDESGSLLAVYEASGGRVKPAVVLIA
jgi:tRNA pseudouridine55 synthase